MSIDPVTATAMGGAQDDLAGRLKRSAERGDRDGVREAAKQFEGYLVQSMVKEMRKATSTGDSIFGGSAMATFQDMFDREIADRIVEGPGLGLADRIIEGMDRAAGREVERPQAHRLGVARSRYAAPAPAPDVLGSAREGWSWPLPGDAPGRVSSSFGVRTDPIARTTRAHHGLDLAAPEGTPIHAVASGRVIRAGAAGGYGNLVEIDHGDGVVTRYAHQRDLGVSVGDTVDAGTVIGSVGSTGRSTGPHLHLEVRVHGDPVDPADWLRGAAK